MSEDDAYTDAVRGFLLQDRERCPECSSAEIDVVEVADEVGAAKCPNCGFQLLTEAGAVLRPDEFPEGFEL